MNTTDKRILLALIERLVNGNKSWREKRADLLAEATVEERTALEEFASWFTQ